MWEGSNCNAEQELKVSFGYQCNGTDGNSSTVPIGYKFQPKTIIQRTSSFSCFSGAALSANATLANTNICNGVLGAEILPTWDSPNSFRKIPSSPSLSRMDMLSSSLQSNMSNLSCSPSSPSEDDSFSSKCMSAQSGNEGVLNAMEVQVAGGAAGEDRVQAVCSEENGWLFCAIYDGFNGRDAADFLAGRLYECIVYYFSLLDWEANSSSVQHVHETENSKIDHEISSDSIRFMVLDCLKDALNQAEGEFLHMVEMEMDDRPDLVSVGSCVLVVLLHGNDLYVLNLGDSRAILATYGNGIEESETKRLKSIQLTDNHTVDNEAERAQLIIDHPDDPMTVVFGKVKGKLKVTHAFGVGYLKKEKLNDALMGILRVPNLISPPYISTEPSLLMHRISESDHFVIVASDGLFDFFSNDEAVRLVYSYILRNPSGDPAKFLLEKLVDRAADCAGLSKEELMNIPAGRRRKYHDDVTVIVIILGTNKRTTKASTCM